MNSLKFTRMIKAIVAFTNNQGIGFDNEILFNIKADQQRFKDLTLNQVVVMGRKTYESLPKSVRPLPKRINKILSRNSVQKEVGLFSYDDPMKLLAKARGYSGDIWVIGGEQIYSLFMPVIEEIEVTRIFSDKEANKFFPSFEKEFELTFQSDMMFDKKNDVEFQYQTWTRKKKTKKDNILEEV
ncbi:MAG: dihydrofolate reductase [Candidatus Pacebacteria bacterium]|nr:dihydrofolate reductase [Candidatus Paceibacterota bacterium]